MKLIIDRFCTKKDKYHFSFGVDYDISIFEEEIWIHGVPKETMPEIDRLITGSIELKFCVLNLKHPLLLEPPSNPLQHFWWIGEDESYRKLREYFALRLIYRRSSVELIEIGKRLFK